MSSSPLIEDVAAMKEAAKKASSSAHCVDADGDGENVSANGASNGHANGGSANGNSNMANGSNGGGCGGLPSALSAQARLRVSSSPVSQESVSGEGEAFKGISCSSVSMVSCCFQGVPPRLV